MTLLKNVRLAAILIVFMATVCNCEKQADAPDTPKQELSENYFTYDGYAFEINSVVKFDEGNSSVELWLSPKQNAKTISEIKSYGDYVVLKTNSAYVNQGKRDLFNVQTSKDSYIRFCNTHEFKYGDLGTAFIQVSFNKNEVSLEFLSQKLYTKSDSAPKAMIQGAYTGAYATEAEVSYNNEWGLDKNRSVLNDARYTTDTSGSNPVITLYSEDTGEAVSIALKSSLIGESVSLPYSGPSADIVVTYNGGVGYNLQKAKGAIFTSISKGEMKVTMDIDNGERRIRASYVGNYYNYHKVNGYNFDYEGESSYEGEHEIVKLMVNDSGASSKFYFSPSKDYNMSTSNSSHMPILNIPSSIINKGKVSFMDMTDWDFSFDVMGVYPMVEGGAEDRPHASENDWIIVNKSGNTYEIAFEITSSNPKCSMYIYYKGNVSE